MNPSDIFFEIEKRVNEVFQVDESTSLEQQILLCSLLKCIEYNQTISKIDNFTGHFFYMPFLRGICEEIIHLTYLFNVIEEQDRSNFVVVYQISDLIKSIESQETFFDSQREFQPVLTKSILKSHILKDLSIDELLLSLKQKYGWERRFPSVKQVATNSDLLSLYEYLYSATSRLVHFNPQTLLQMVWGEFKNGKFVKGDISIKHFEKYYREFCQFYGYYLLKVFNLNLRTHLPVDLSIYISDLDEFYKNKRWPEIITFEEMNIPIDSGSKLHSFEKKGIEGYMSTLMNQLLKKK
jgi:Family of unknown function (DUF5677)